MFIDFEYNGLRLSDFGFVLCDFSGPNGVQVLDNGSDIKFTTAPILKGNKFLLSDSKYEECLSATFQICKTPCSFSMEDIEEITVDEVTNISRWLCQKEYKKFILLKEGYEQIYFEGSFMLDRIQWREKTVGLELKLATNRPFALYEPLTKKLDFTASNQTLLFRDISDEIGFILPEITITCSAAGDLVIHNSIEDRETVITNCKAGEVITMNYPHISSSNPSHAIQNDFNYNFFRIANKWNDNLNKITTSIPCTIKFKYSPIRKVGI